MLLLLTPAPVKRSRRQVSELVLAAPVGRRSLAWWQRYLAERW